MSLAQQIKEQAHAFGFELAGIAPAQSSGWVRPLAGLARARLCRHHGLHGAASRSTAPPGRRLVLRSQRGHGGDELRTAALLCGADPWNALESVRSPATRAAPIITTSCARSSTSFWRGFKTPSRALRAAAWWTRLRCWRHDFAHRAGLGWFGKNTMLIHKKLGSYFFLGALLLDLELQPDNVFTPPTVAPAPHASTPVRRRRFLHPECSTPAAVSVTSRSSCARRYRPSLREPVGDWIFGCDICQEVCPWNRKAPATREPAFQAPPGLEGLDLVELLGLSEEEFRRRFKGTALYRSKRRGLFAMPPSSLEIKARQRPFPLWKKRSRTPNPWSARRRPGRWRELKVRLKGAGVSELRALTLSACLDRCTFRISLLILF